MPIARILFLEALLAGAVGAFYVDIFWLAGVLVAMATILGVFGFRLGRGDTISWSQKRALVRRFAATKAQPVSREGDARMRALRAVAPTPG
jgi:hypothetical protein